MGKWKTDSTAAQKQCCNGCHSTPSNHPQRTHSWCITPDRWQPNLFYKTASAIPLVMLQGFFLCICIFSYEQEMLLKCFKMSSINLSSSSLRLFFLIAWKIDDSFSSLKHPWCICKLLPQHLYTKQPITFQFPSDFFGDTQLCLLISCQLPLLGSKDLFYCFWGIAALSSWFFLHHVGLLELCNAQKHQSFSLAVDAKGLCPFLFMHPSAFVLFPTSVTPLSHTAACNLFAHPLLRSQPLRSSIPHLFLHINLPLFLNICVCYWAAQIP